MRIASKILCFGDSVTFGDKAKNGGWVQLLKAYYFNCEQENSVQKNSVKSVYNLGVQSENSDGLVGRFETELVARVHKRESKIVLIAYGLNDVIIHKDKNRVPREYFERNLSSCIRVALNLGCELKLLTITPINNQFDGQANLDGHVRFQKNIKEYNLLIQDLALKFGIGFVDIANEFEKHAVSRTLLGGDGLHPNDGGHEVIFNAVKQSLDE